MKKIMTTSLLAMCAVMGTAGASPLWHGGTFDIGYRPTAGNFFADTGAAFQTGMTEDGGSMTDFASGETGQMSLDMMYGITDMFAVTFDIGNRRDIGGGLGLAIASPNVGLNWRVLNDSDISIELLAKYGLAWTTEAVAPNDRIGQNNIQAGGRIFGLVGHFQWGFDALLQYVFVEPDDMMNLNMLVQGQYNFDKSLALYTEFGYDIVGIDQDIMLYDRYLNVGCIYNITSTAAVQPYVGYHFASANSDNSNTAPDNYWQIGGKFAVQF